MTDQQMRWAIPSCVIPANVVENARFLAGKAPEIGLCLFEWQSCLAYGREDLPPDLASLPLAWHLHLPLDLPWEKGGEEAGGICEELCAKTAFLKPWAAVLHPPKGKGKKDLLERFARQWRGNIPILLENVAWCDVLELGWDFLAKNAFGFCMDVAHALGYAQTELIDYASKARLLHWSAPCGGDRHKPLTCLNVEELKQAAEIMKRARGVHMLEIFSWDDVTASLGELQKLAGEGHDV